MDHEAFVAGRSWKNSVALPWAKGRGSKVFHSCHPLADEAHRCSAASHFHTNAVKPSACIIAKTFYTSAISRRRLIVDRVAAAAGVETVYAPPAICRFISVSLFKSLAWLRCALSVCMHAWAPGR